jgi:uncharacterized membrane protein (DUF106 family)
MKYHYSASDFGPNEVVVGNDFTSYPFNAMKYDYNAAIPNPIGSNGLTIDSEIINNSLIDCDHIQRIKKDVELLANDTSKDLNALQSDLNLLQSEIKIIKAITGKEIEKLQKELQEFKKDTNKFLRHLIDTSIILSVAIVFILILIIFYNK